MLIDHWPLLGLRIRTARLELRLPTEPELADLADLAAAGVAGPTAAGSPEHTDPAVRARAVVQGHWLSRGAWTPDDWSLELAVFLRGRPIGVQGMRSRDFRDLRTVETHTWLSREHRGRGIGTETWAAMLHLAFDGLDALQATTVSLVDSPAAAAVAGKLGYRAAGTEDWRLRRHDRDRAGRPDVTLSGLPACRPMFGA